MKQIRLSGQLSLSQVVFGCMRITKELAGAPLLSLVEQCLDMGIDSFDHAPVYGGYTCERIFGESVLAKKPELRKKMKLVTKTGIIAPHRKGNETIYYESTAEEFRKELEDSLQNLHTDHIDLLLVHRPDFLMNPQEAGQTLDQFVKEGKVLEVGVSNFMPSQIDMLQSGMKSRIVTNQMEFSVKNVVNFENGVSDYGLSHNMPMMAWSPLGGGSIFTGEDEVSVRLRKVLTEIAETYSSAIDTIMYAFLFRHPLPLMAVTGTMKEERIRRAVEATDITLSYEEWYRILAASRGYDVP